MLRRTIALLRAVRFSLHLVQGLITALVYPALPAHLRRHILRRWSAGLLAIFNVRVEVGPDDALHTLQGGLLVTNHISWLDVFVLNAIIPMRFVAKSEVRSWPVFGWLCAQAGTLFIERGKARDAARLNLQLVELLQAGECLAIFPEGTTTDGSLVAHFHASLLQPVIDAGTALHPVAIRYQDADGTRSTAAAYIDELSFAASLWNILSTPELHVRLIATPALGTQDTDRRTLARLAHGQICHALQQAESQNFHPALTPVQQSDINLLPSTR
jgi:1-acyl-sn-glycerol-3-phosphate acyltransferase